MRKVLLATLIALALPSYAQHHPVYSGKVVRVLDGRTLHITVTSPGVPAGTMSTVRLWGIDLSSHREHAQAATKLLTELALNRNVHVDVYGKQGDWVQTEGSQTSLSAALVSAGLARRWKSSGIRDFEHHERDLESAEKEAKEEKRGIWKSAQQKPTTGYASVNGVKMYYEIHGPDKPGFGNSGEPVVLLHGAFMTITNNWTGWIEELSKTRKVIAIEMQGHGRTADVSRDITYDNLADDVAALLYDLKIPRADLIGYSMGGSVAIQCAIRHPDKVRKAVIVSARFRHDGFAKEGLDAIRGLTADVFKGSPLETEYKKLSPTPDGFPDFVQRIVAMAAKPFDFGADKLKANPTPMFFIHGDADGVLLAHIAEMFRLKGGETHGDMMPRSASRLAILPDTTHVTLMQRIATIVPLVNDFLDAKP